MKTSILYFLIFAYFIISGRCVDRNCSEIQDYISKKGINNKAYNHAIEFNKTIIPCLIKLIDTHGIGFVGFPPPTSSTIDKYNIKNYIGINSAYLIELLLSRDTIISNVSNIWTNENHPYRIYKSCVIFKIENDIPMKEPLKLDDVIAIKRKYSLWWNKNKDKTIIKLREEWKDEKNRALYQSNYIWY